MSLTFGSLFSGVEGLGLGLEQAGMRCAWQVEKDRHCRSVLARHWPAVTRYEDVREVGAHNLAPVDLVCGGFPCQDISRAGRAVGLAGERSGLWSEFHRVIGELAPRWVLIENVDALLSVNGGDDLAVVLNALGELGYGWAYRVLDAQHFGVPQRRRRVFIVGHLGAPWSASASVLFEPESLHRHPAESSEAGTETPGRVVVSTLQGGGARGYRVDAESAGGGQLVTVYHPHRTMQRDGTVSEGFSEGQTANALFASGHSNKQDVIYRRSQP